MKKLMQHLTAPLLCVALLPSIGTVQAAGSNYLPLPAVTQTQGPLIALGNAVNLESLGRDDHVSIRFQPAPDAAIDPGTVKVLIGGKDKTLQFRMIADISERGIEASLKHVPAGRQEVQISVQDTKKREAVLKAMVNIKA